MWNDEYNALFDTANTIKSNITSAHYFLNYFHKGLHLSPILHKIRIKFIPVPILPVSISEQFFLAFQAKLTLLDYSRDKPSSSVLRVYSFSGHL